jgi:hypothetical protein
MKMAYEKTLPSVETAAPGIARNIKENATLEKLVGEKLDCVGSILSEIEATIASRRTLSNQFIRTVDQQYCYIKDKLFDLRFWPVGNSTLIDSRRTALEQQLDSMMMEKRQETIHCWHDIAEMLTELRSWFKQYCDLKQRANLMLPTRAKDYLPGSRVYLTKHALDYVSKLPTRG